MSDKTKLSEYTPTMKMRYFVQALLSDGVMGNQTRAEAISGVRRQSFNWMFRNNPKFRAWFASECDRVLAENEARVSGALMREVIRGDVQAIRTYYQLRGKLKGEGVNVSVSASANASASAQVGKELEGEDAEFRNRMRDEISGYRNN